MNNFLLGLCAVFIAMNWLGLACSMAFGRSYSFAPPFLAGIVGSLVALVHSNPTVNAFAWVPLVLDPSIGLALGAISFTYLKKKFCKR